MRQIMVLADIISHGWLANKANNSLIVETTVFG